MSLLQKAKTIRKNIKKSRYLKNKSKLKGEKMDFGEFLNNVITGKNNSVMR